MEKSIFFFRRKPDRTPEDFAHHYITNHAPLGKRLTQGLRGYTVNIINTDGFPAAVTEHWVPDVMHLLTPSRAYASAEDFNQVLQDDQSLFSGFDLYVVTQERTVVPGPTIDSPLEQRTPGTKLIWTYADAGNLPPPASSAYRVVDNLVSHKLVLTDSYDWEVADAGFEIIRMAWTVDDDLGKEASGALSAAEYRFIAAPSWDVA
ncbi:MAG TPA: hypothetical protein VJQ77_01515 [Novosphingobium sp.]|nr:hypothetical protein [Novosphingobium sp.]